MTTRISTDLRDIQQAVSIIFFYKPTHLLMDIQVAQDAVEEDVWFPSLYLTGSSTGRNALIIPEDESSIQISDIGMSVTEHMEVYLDLPKVAISSESTKEHWAHVLVVGDFDSEEGRRLLHEAIQARKEDPDLELVLLHNQQDSRNLPTLSAVLYGLQVVDYLDSLAKLEELLKATPSPIPQDEDATSSLEFWNSAQALAKALGFSAGQNGLVVNGRVIGPIPESLNFSKDDFKQLLKYERNKRSIPALSAALELVSFDKVDCPLAAARLSSLVALSTVSDVPEGIFETPSTLRTTVFEQWNDTYTAIQTGDIDAAIIQIVALVDPASELAQRWVPILKVLSELSGVHLKLFMNPQEVLGELPVKRFYRYVLDARPTFESNGSLTRPRARFTGIPGEALLTAGMDVPPSWLVAPRECIYDLDNIKLNSLKDRLRGSDVSAVYELEHILIEGH
jgi:UDP-glucose:glycoprotein glucosyltransferase